MSVEDIVKAVQDLPSDPAELEKLADAIVDAYEKINGEAGDSPTDEQMDQIDALSDAMAKVQAKLDDVKAKEAEEADAEAALKAEREAAHAATAEMFAKAKADRDARNVQDDTPDEFSAEDETPEDDDEPSDEDDSAEEDAEGQDDADEDNEDEDKDGAKGTVSEKDKEMSVNKSRFAGRTKGDQTPPRDKATETPFRLDPAAMNYTNGAVSMEKLADAFNDMSSGKNLRALSTGSATSAHFGHIKRDLEGVTADSNNITDVIAKATDERNLENGSLVAAGGWCAPSETIYDFLPTSAPTGLFSLPEIGISRGGLRFPVEPDFSVLYDHTKFQMTEAQAIAGQTKECVTIPCAEMDEIRLDIGYLCVQTDNLSRVGWPELTAKFLAEAVKGYSHRLSAMRLAKARSLSQKVSPGVPVLGTIGTVLNALELHAEDIRLKYRLGEGATIEAVGPAWLRPILRADMAYRDNMLPTDITNQMIDSHFATRGVRFQWVSDYQTDIIGSGAAGLTYPESVEVLMYPAGTFFSALEPVINLGVTYDSAGIAKNQRTEMFVEDGWAVAKRAYESRALTLPVDVNGHTGLRAEVAAAVVTGAGDDQGEG